MAAPPRGDSIRVLSTDRVAPSSTAGGTPLPERAVPLTFLDAIWLQSPPVERVFFYRLCGAPFAGDADAVLSTLVDSLSRVLHVFHPLAGRLRLTPGKTNRYEIFYQPGDGVAFTVAEHDGVGVGELVTDDPRELAKIAPLVPNLPEGGALLAVQATVLLPARRGLALGVTVHHAACDGSSSTHFLHTWAAACAGAAVPLPPPVVDRTLIREREDFYDLTTRTDDHLKKFYSPDLLVDKLLTTFTLSRDNLQSIKHRVAGVSARRGLPPPRCTSIVATFAVIWQCHIRAAALGDEAEPGNGGRAHFIFLTDHRARMQPRVPEKYLGNCVGPCFASAPKKEIAPTGADGLFTACSVIAAAIDEAMRCEPDYWDRCMEHGKELSTIDGAPFSVAGSPRFRVYDVDFGFGRPTKVEIVSVGKTGAMSVAEGRGGSGGIEVGIALPPERMERFRRCFSDAVAWLSSSSSSSRDE
ncbi:hypothetical protein E2562_028870 [Oryza meyeriana var. granulata]|uniref:Uncharacterized protein n=1 Tax=Oryza meyeriana var. granulata TaxID=110450 RepID=A0A6G1FD79_9ORYZ|nr:hypothetical protein E2562_028870 [Oryza meyeriana var. granulata]